MKVSRPRRGQRHVLQRNTDPLAVTGGAAVAAVAAVAASATYSPHVTSHAGSTWFTGLGYPAGPGRTALTRGVGVD